MDEVEQEVLLSEVERQALIARARARLADPEFQQMLKRTDREFEALIRQLGH